LSWLSSSSSFRRGQGHQDEHAWSEIHSKVEGWIEQVHAEFTGARVEKPAAAHHSTAGDARTQQEYLLGFRLAKY